MSNPWILNYFPISLISVLEVLIIPLSIFQLFHVTGFFLYLLKTSENQRVFLKGTESLHKIVQWIYDNKEEKQKVGK